MNYVNALLPMIWLCTRDAEHLEQSKWKKFDKSYIFFPPIFYQDKKLNEIQNLLQECPGQDQRQVHVQQHNS